MNRTDYIEQLTKDKNDIPMECLGRKERRKREKEMYGSVKQNNDEEIGIEIPHTDNKSVGVIFPHNGSGIGFSEFAKQISLSNFRLRNKINHVEAFCIMTYECECCGKIEKVWNSRDGVTPFCITCDCKHTMKHVKWERDIFDPFYIPPIGSRVFIDTPIEKVISNWLEILKLDFILEEDQSLENYQRFILDNISINKNDLYSPIVLIVDENNQSSLKVGDKI